MAKDYKTLLVIDDSEIDREILKSMLGDEFDIIESENGFAALEIILNKKEHIDAILLDVSMPVLDGFSVLQIMKENRIADIPVFMISAEATKDNVQKATQYNISEFIKKPFNRDEILRRIKTKLGVVDNRALTEIDIVETNKYISSLRSIYDKYMKNFDIDQTHYQRMVSLMKILLNKYYASNVGLELDREQIELISKAAYFCDIGNMVMPQNWGMKSAKKDEIGRDIYQTHTLAGAEIVRLNGLRYCDYFIHICADLCLHHHERYDGHGYPHGIYGDNNSIYAQMCWLVGRFDDLFNKYREHNDVQFDFAVKEIELDKGAVGPKVFSLLVGSKNNIIAFYNTKH